MWHIKQVSLAYLVEAQHALYQQRSLSLSRWSAQKPNFFGRSTQTSPFLRFRRCLVLRWKLPLNSDIKEPSFSLQQRLILNFFPLSSSHWLFIEKLWLLLLFFRNISDRWRRRSVSASSRLKKSSSQPNFLPQRNFFAPPGSLVRIWVVRTTGINWILFAWKDTPAHPTNYTTWVFGRHFVRCTFLNKSVHIKLFCPKLHRWASFFCCTTSRDLLRTPNLGIEWEEKSPASGGSQTHYLKSSAPQACALPLCYNCCRANCFYIRMFGRAAVVEVRLVEQLLTEPEVRVRILSTNILNIIYNLVFTNSC